MVLHYLYQYKIQQGEDNSEKKVFPK